MEPQENAMTNAYTTPPTLPNPDNLVVGNKVRAVDIDPIRDAFNFAIATGGHALAQSWPQGEHQRTGTAKVTCSWWLAHPTNSHEFLTIRFRATGSVAGGTVTLISSLGPSVAVPILLGGPTEYSVSLKVGSADESQLDLGIGHATGTVTVGDISAWWDALPSPLPAGGIDVGLTWGGPGRSTIYPLGATENGTADRPIPASRGRRTLGSLRSLIWRPRQIAAWSGLDNTTGTPLGSPSMQDYPHRAVFVMTPGGGFRFDDRISDKVQLYIYAVGRVAETYIYPQLGGSFTSRRRVIVVAAAAPGQWYSFPMTLRATRQYLNIPWPTITVGLWPTSGTESGRTTADVRSWSAVSGI